MGNLIKKNKIGTQEDWELVITRQVNLLTESVVNLANQMLEIEKKIITLRDKDAKKILRI